MHLEELLSAKTLQGVSVKDSERHYFETQQVLNKAHINSQVALALLSLICFVKTFRRPSANKIPMRGRCVFNL